MGLCWLGLASIDQCETRRSNWGSHWSSTPQTPAEKSIKRKKHEDEEENVFKENSAVLCKRKICMFLWYTGSSFVVLLSLFSHYLQENKEMRLGSLSTQVVNLVTVAVLKTTGYWTLRCHSVTWKKIAHLAHEQKRAVYPPGSFFAFHSSLHITK